MITAARNYLIFIRRCTRIAFVGDWRYYAWMGLLTVISLLGLNAYAKQLVHGLIVTGMSDEVSWGVYIANFTFLVGVAAAAVMMVIPVYIYDNEELHDLVIFGELLAVAAIIMCLAFVTVDLGRPDRFWHLIPGIGQLNFPRSMLSWDVIVLNGYLLLNVHICGYLLYCRYQNRKPGKCSTFPLSSRRSSGRSRFTPSRPSSMSASAAGRFGTPRLSARAFSPLRSRRAPRSSFWRCRSSGTSRVTGSPTRRC
jgi:Polysulphide reductase, NrfD